MSKIYDIHPHIIAPDADKYPLDPLGGVQSGWSATRPASFEQLIAAMDEAGVTKSAIVQSSTCYGFDNSYVADSVATMPERFTGIYSIDIFAPDAIATIDHWRARGMSSLRLFTGGSTMATDGSWLVDPATFPVWEYCGQIGMSICIQTTSEGLPYVVEQLERFPEVNIVLDHLGRPDLTDGAPYAKAQPLFDMAKYKNLYLKVSPRTFDLAQAAPATPETFFPKLVAAFGANRIAFGSNFPANTGTLKSLIDQGHACFACLSKDDRDWIWWRTAETLYPALADHSAETVTESAE